MPELDKKGVAFNVTNKKHQKLYDHYVETFKQKPVFCLRLKKNVLSNEMKPITTLVFEPSKDMPFWKLCTIGASDYLMPERDIGWGRKANQRNEYMMLIDPEVEISQEKTGWRYRSTHCSGQLLNTHLMRKKILRFPIPSICKSKANTAELYYCSQKYLNLQA